VIKKPGLLCKKLGLTFNNPQLFIIALTHRSHGSNNNERLEFLGDSILGFVIAQKLFDLFPEASEGVLSRLRASLVNQGSLAELAREHKLGDYLLLGAGELRAVVVNRPVRCHGSYYWRNDQGMDVCQKWILKLFEKKLNGLSLDNWQKDPKTQLQELMQSGKMDLPDYTLMDMSGLAHEQTFKVKCTIPLSATFCVGTGNSRKKAEQSAAEQMLELLNKDNK
jgi:ribonuclease-3